MLTAHSLLSFIHSSFLVIPAFVSFISFSTPRKCDSFAGALNGSATSSTAGAVEFTWYDNSSEGNTQATDKTLILAYNKTKGEAVFVTGGALRTAGVQTLTVPNDFSGDAVECFIAFISADGLSVSTSKYVGSINRIISDFFLNHLD